MTTKWWTAIGALAAVLAAGVGIMSLRSGDVGEQRQATAEGEDGNTCVNTGEGSQTCDYGPILEDLAGRTERQIIESAEGFGAAPPVGDAPWPFVVVGTAPIGLKVRTTNAEIGTQIGAIANLNSAWAWCQEQSEFDPVPGDENGAVWFQIAWDHQEPNETDYLQSESSATARGWIYGGFVVPVGHNGVIPNC